ncbi:mechanosensitive ion channel [Trinickia violacea]|uniref:Mechanosensitive ion channel n=1 Tax=Trinickia violacea TaxID=2571746 RepID=A0A4P8J2L6_9BURK|nr:mechanosensitive ion channel domain-containing protein [Trinickia violacea]QCP54004.1 mechanosensitive ion channel [Trinickia violacea]
MRKTLLVFLFLSIATLGVASPSGAATPAAAPASNPSPVALTPDEARRALEVLNDPARRVQIEDTLRAIAAAGALSAPPASAAVPASAAASAPSAASAASGTLTSAFKANGLASQLSRQVAGGLHVVSGALGRSTAALLDTQSVRAWWRDEMASPQGVALLWHLAWVVLGTLIPAGLLAALTHYVFKKRVRALVGRKIEIEEEAMRAARRHAAATEAEAKPPASAADVAASAAAARATDTAAARIARNAEKAGHHWTVLQRLPIALLRIVLKAVPLLVFIVAAIALMSALTDEGSPGERVLDSLIQIFAICRAIALAGEFFFAPQTPRLRLLRLSDTWAQFAQRWVIRLVAVLGVGAGIAAVPLPLGLAPEAHLAIVKVVTLIGHVMISILILQCRRPVARWIRKSMNKDHSLLIVGNWLADVWAGLAVFFVMALWFVWALDVHNGYRVLLHRGGLSVLVLIGARLVAMVTFGVLGRIFKLKEGETGSIAFQHAYRYYPLLRRIASAIILLIMANLLLSAWGIHVWHTLASGSIGSRLASAFTTIAVAAIIALVVWESINIALERRLDVWTADGDIVRAARLRTLVPMLRAVVFIVIALVVVLTGLSELGVNTAPLLAGASIFGVALGFGSQKLVQDFITGIFLLMENALQVGDWVTLAGVSGTVEYLSIRTVRLRGSDGSLYTVPFSSVSTVNNTNRGIGNAAVSVSIVYGQDIDLAVATLKEIGDALREDERFKDGILSDFAYWGVDKVDGALVTMSGQVQCRDTKRWAVQREFNLQIAQRFKEKGIEIANPQRNVLVGEGVIERPEAVDPQAAKARGEQSASSTQTQGRVRNA